MYVRLRRFCFKAELWRQVLILNFGILSFALSLLPRHFHVKFIGTLRFLPAVYRTGLPKFAILPNDGLSHSVSTECPVVGRYITSHVRRIP